MNRIYIKLLVLSLFLVMASKSYTQDVPPPPPPSNHGSNGNQNGGGAPIGGGVLMLIGMGTAYGVRKFVKKRNKK